MKQKLFPLFIAISVFSTYYLFISNNLLIPILWSLFIVYLSGKKHFYIGINSYILLILYVVADKINFELKEIREFMYSLVVIFITLLFVLIYQELQIKKFKLTSIFTIFLSLFFYMIPLVYIIYAINFDANITLDVISAIAQTNSQESIEFIQTYISPLWIIIIISLTAIVGWIFLKQEQMETDKIEKSLLLFLLIILAQTIYVNRQDIKLYSFAKDGTKKYKIELNSFKHTRDMIKEDKIPFNATKSNDEETYVVIIGESLNKNHMSLYNYFRDTTPKLNARKYTDGLLIFDNVYSNHTHTMPTLSLALTEANQINHKKYYESMSIVNILNKADFETFWITNQNLYGEWDLLSTAIASDAKHLIATNDNSKKTDNENYDGELIHYLERFLNSSNKKNKVFFVHLMGSHSDYCKRYPEEYKIFDNEILKEYFGSISDEAGLSQDINCYDNSVYYNDFVINSVLSLLQKESGVRGLIYLSDHADDVVHKLGHNSGKFTYEMTQIPMLAWFSDEYKVKYKHKYFTLKNNISALFDNDFLYDTLIGIMDINASKYDASFDLSSEKYSFSYDEAYVLHGKKLYTDEDNYIFWQRQNTKFLTDINQSSRIFPHRVNSIGKLKDIWDNGFRSFEVDIRFDNKKQSLHVGHDPSSMGVPLGAFLSNIDYRKIQRMWFDLKNLTENNYQEILLELSELDKKYSIKNKIILESGSTSPYLKRFSDEGWHTSYYLPTKEIKKIFKDSKNLSLKIAKQVKEQNLSAVSFDHRLYPFVKEYLENLLPENVVYHVWYGPNLYDKNFNHKLLKNTLYLDQRIKTILVQYKSNFHL